MVQAYGLRMALALAQAVSGLALVVLKLVWDSPLEVPSDWFVVGLWSLLALAGVAQAVLLMRERRRSSVSAVGPAR